MKESEIKLFGRKIVFPEKWGEFVVGESSDESACSAASCGGGCLEKSDEEVKEDQVTEKDQASGVICEDKDVDPSDAQESQYTNTSSETEEDNPKKPTMIEVVSEDHAKTENEQSDATNEQKTLKKPDKILPCPRCNSMDTKFCYYNNYNVNQPRHFCKSCQRYWTAGGIMRNVPVGAGRRKSKNSASHCSHITISEALHAAKIDSPNGAVLSFGPDSSLYESMSSALNLAEKKVAEKKDGVKNGYYKTNNTENGDNYSFGSSITSSNSVTDKNAPHQPTMQNVNGIPTPVSCIPGAPWPVPWNSAVPLPAIYPVPFYPPPYWNCAMPSPWNGPWVSIPSPKATGSNPSSPLGKHSRNGELINSESSIVVPKTLRIDDPEEAAKSSIWTTLGIKYDGTSREGLFKTLQPKGDSKKSKGVGSPAAWQANPAALSRSITFQESVPN